MLGEEEQREHLGADERVEAGRGKWGSGAEEQRRRIGARERMRGRTMNASLAEDDGRSELQKFVTNE